MIIISHVVSILHVFDRGALQGHEEVVDNPKVPLNGILHVARALVEIIGDGLRALMLCGMARDLERYMLLQ